MIRSLRLSWPLMAALLAVLCTAAPASADYRDVLAECENGLSKQYSAKDLRTAAQKMSAYQRDYTTCSDAIVQAQTSGKRARDRATSGNGGSGTGNGGTGTGTGTDSNGSTGGTGTSSGGAPADAAPSPSLTADQQYTARNAATAAADAGGTIEQAFAAARVPPEALSLASSSNPLPVTLVVALAASALLAIAAAVFSFLARVRRTRVD